MARLMPAYLIRAGVAEKAPCLLGWRFQLVGLWPWHLSRALGQYNNHVGRDWLMLSTPINGTLIAFFGVVGN